MFQHRVPMLDGWEQQQEKTLRLPCKDNKKKKSGINLKKTAVRNKEDFMRQRKYRRTYESELLKKALYYIFKGINCNFPTSHW